MIATTDGPQRFRVLATARSFCRSDGPHHDYLAQHGCDVELRPPDQPLPAAQLAELLPGHHGVILGLDVCDASALESADRLKVISRFGVGTDAVDLEAARRNGIAVTITPGSNTGAVAEATIGLIFALARDLPAAVAGTRAGRWQRRSGWELDGKTLGLIGFGAIGRAVALKALALGMRIVAFDPHVEVAMPGVRAVDLQALLISADVVSLHAPLTPETRNLLDRGALARMKTGAYLVNTARGGLVDESALLEVLEDGHLAGAALDVFAHEPPSDSPLIGHDRVIATPHLGAHTREATLRTAMLAAENLVSVLRGEACPNVVNRVPPSRGAVTEAP